MPSFVVKSEAPLKMQNTILYAVRGCTERTGQDRTGQDRTGDSTLIMQHRSSVCQIQRLPQRTVCLSAAAGCQRVDCHYSVCARISGSACARFGARLQFAYHGKGRPTRTSKIFEPIEDETAMSPCPCLATITLVSRSGTLVPAARKVSPITAS
jgi:hypothetical protein